MTEFKLGPHQSLITKSDTWVFDRDGDAELLEKQMIEFMLTNKGIGLAANQVNLIKRVFVMGSYDIPGFPTPFALFNPRIIESSKEQILDREGCLSYPGLYLSVKRPQWVVAEYQDSQGNSREIKIDGYLSKCFQHELDHLDGVCFVDRVSRLKLNLAMQKLGKHK
jgi:peptide deformylase